MEGWRQYGAVLMARRGQHDAVVMAWDRHRWGQALVMAGDWRACGALVMAGYGVPSCAHEPPRHGGQAAACMRCSPRAVHSPAAEKRVEALPMAGA